MAGDAKYGRNETKCKRYRARVGKPRGPGVAGNKFGKNKNAKPAPSPMTKGKRG